MAEKQVIPLRILGYNGKYDPKIAPPGVLSAAENVQAFRRTGEGAVELRKRNGFTEVPGGKSINGGGSIAAAVTGAAYNDELILCDGLKLYSRSDVLAKWLPKGKLQSIAADVFRVSGNETIVGYDGISENIAPPQPNTDSAYQDGYACYVTSTNGNDNSQGSSRVYVKDLTSGAIIISAALGVNDHRAKVLGIASSFYVFTWNPITKKIQCRRIQTGAPSAIGSPADVATDAKGPGTYGSTAGLGLYDVAVDVTATRMWVAYRNSGDDLVIKSWTTANATGVSSTYIGIDPNLSIGFLKQDFSGGSGYVAVATDAGVSRTVNLITFQTSDAVVTANSTLQGYGDTAEIPHVTGHRSGSTNNVLWTLGGPTPFFRYAVVGHSGATFTVCLGLSLASRTFTANGKWYFVGNYTGEAPGSSRLTLIEMDDNATGADGQISPAGLLMSIDACDPPVSASHLPSVPMITVTNGFVSAPAILNEAIDGVGTSTAHFALNSVSLDFSGVGLGRPEKYNDLLHVPCAAHKTYDGRDVVEAAFYVDPEAPGNLLVAAGSGGELQPNKTYQYCVTWSRFDAYGRLHRSSPGPITSITTPLVGVQPNPIVTGVVYTLRLTDTDPRFNLNPDVIGSRIEVWRTPGDSDIFYLNKILDNDATVDQIDFDDRLPDSSLELREVLYTQSEELDNQKVPAVKVLHAFQQRLFALTGDGSIWHSKESAEGFGAEFSDEFRILTDGSNGRPTTLGSIDTLFFAFKRKRAFFTQGQGPDDKGAGSPFPRLQPLEVDLGVVNATGAIDVPGGIMCEAATGRFLLNRSLAFEPMEGTETQSVTVVGGVGLDTRSMTVFVTNGALLARDWQLGQWLVWSKTSNGLAGVAIVRWRGQLCVIQSDGTVLREVVGQFFDAVSTAIAESVEFSFVRLENCRLHQCRVVGEIMGSTTLTATVTYDGNESTAASKTKAVTTGNKEDLNMIPSRGRATSVKFKLSESSTSEGFRLSMVGLEVQLKAGLSKVSADRNFT